MLCIKLTSEQVVSRAAHVRVYAPLPSAPLQYTSYDVVAVRSGHVKHGARLQPTPSFLLKRTVTPARLGSSTS